MEPLHDRRRHDQCIMIDFFQSGSITVRVRLSALILLFAIASINRVQAQVQPDFSAWWGNMTGETKKLIAAGIIQGLLASMGAIDIALRDPRVVAQSDTAWADAIKNYNQAMKDFGYGAKSNSFDRPMISPDELVARLDAFYLKSGHEGIEPWQAVFLILVMRNVPEWPIKNELR